MGVREEAMTPPFLDQNVQVTGFEPRTPQRVADRRITWLSGIRQVSVLECVPRWQVPAEICL